MLCLSLRPCAQQRGLAAEGPRPELSFRPGAFVLLGVPH
jgi:hypothetical protein